MKIILNYSINAQVHPRKSKHSDIKRFLWASFTYCYLPNRSTSVDSTFINFQLWYQTNSVIKIAMLYKKSIWRLSKFKSLKDSSLRVFFRQYRQKCATSDDTSDGCSNTTITIICWYTIWNLCFICSTNCQFFLKLSNQKTTMNGLYKNT